MTDILLLIPGIVLIVMGLIGCIVPVIPGPPLSYVGILLLHFTSWVDFSSTFLIVWLIMVIAVTVLDYVIPAWGTKKFGGSKWGVWGSIIGLLVGLFAGGIGIFVGPFVGALVGELIYQKRKKNREGEAGMSGGQQFGKSMKAAFGAFIGLIFGIILKLVVSGILAFSFFKEIILTIF